MRFALVLLVALLAAAPADAQRVAKYGADFLAGGVGARALGMGGVHVALAEDVTAGYWNPAGLQRIDFPQASYMHAERFGGIVQFDYGAVAVPLDGRSTLGVSFFRSGVDDIPNTLDAWENGQPRADRVSFFSAADYAFFVSYAREIRDGLTLGGTAKLVQRSIGDFASAWGYSADVGAQYQLGSYVVGVTLQDITGMLQSWSVDREALRGLEENYENEGDLGFGEMPQGGAEIVLPVARLGAGVARVPLTGDLALTAGLDLDIAFDGQRSYALNLGDASFHPRLGAEVDFRNLVALRLGISDVTTSERFGTQLTPTVGAGVNLGPLAVDYGFGDFGGIREALGYSHRVSLRYTLRSDRFARGSN